MLIIVPERKKLRRDIVNAIKNTQLTNEELLDVYSFVQQDYETSLKNFKIGSVIAAVVTVIMGIVILHKAFMAGYLLAYAYFAGMCLTVAGGMLLLKGYYVDTMKRQFLRAVRQGYPNFTTLYNID